MVFSVPVLNDELVWSRPNSPVISQMWQLPFHFQAAPNIFTII